MGEVVGAEVGWYVKFYVRGVSAHLKPQFEDRLLTFCSLLPHEQRMSVLNFAVRRSPLSSPNAVKSKERLIFQCGWRRFPSCSGPGLPGEAGWGAEPPGDRNTPQRGSG